MISWSLMTAGARGRTPSRRRFQRGQPKRKKLPSLKRKHRAAEPFAVKVFVDADRRNRNKIFGMAPLVFWVVVGVLLVLSISAMISFIKLSRDGTQKKGNLSAEVEPAMPSESL
ncbi:uncharacterized protein LOC100904330 [Galendromus occidentalis]|uniref:Uncharacterized protein LOC100904330 n=1 Tax=Galendromus occidentalis TaxID=34638 RepID=A0AAJ6QVD1_9ACAR|nr:uncharacterized protein LOC100904330 [Galendromus occidentalis]